MLCPTTKNGGLSLKEYMGKLFEGFSALQELAGRADDAATADALALFQRLSSVQLHTIIAAVARDVGELYIHNDGVDLRVEMRRCAQGRTETRCCEECTHAPPPRIHVQTGTDHGVIACLCPQLAD